METVMTIKGIEKEVITLDEFKNCYKENLIELRQLMNEGNEIVKGLKSQITDPSYYVRGTVVYGNREYNEKHLGEHGNTLRHIQMRIESIVRKCKHIVYFNPIENDMRITNVR